MKKTILITIITAICLIQLANAVTVLNMTMNTTHGTYNNSFSQNLAIGQNGSVTHATYTSTGGKNSGVYYCNGSSVIQTPYFKTTSSDNTEVSAFIWYKGTTTGIVIAHYDTANYNRSWSAEITGDELKVLLRAIRSGKKVKKSDWITGKKVED